MVCVITLNHVLAHFELFCQTMLNHVSLDFVVANFCARPVCLCFFLLGDGQDITNG